MLRVNIKTIMLLSSVLLLLSAYACGSSEPLPDIGATVEARVLEELATKPALDFTSVALGQAMSKPTVKAVPDDVALPSIPTPLPPTSTPTSTPTPVPPTPTPTSTPTPVPPTPTPTSTPMPTPVVVNLAPYQPLDWEAPLVVSRDVCSLANVSHSTQEDTQVSWAEKYTGPSQTDQRYYTDILFDGVVVERWSGNDLDPLMYYSVNQWEGLSEHTRVTSGEHTLSLVVDSTNLVNETNEEDNVFTQCFMWTTAEHEPITPSDLSRAPDLVPFGSDVWNDALIATSYQGSTSDGQLSVDVPSIISYGIQNQGLSSFSERVLIHLYLDDILVHRSYVDGVLIDDYVLTKDWTELLSVTNVAEGSHTLKVVVDPTDLVVESDEGNNMFEKQFTWGSGPIAAMPIETPMPIPTPPAQLTLPNLIPGWPYGWDGPIIVSREEQTFMDSVVTANETFFVDVVVGNQSTVKSPPFSVDLYLNGEKIDTFEFDELSSEWFAYWEDWSPHNKQIQMDEGPHTLSLVIDPNNVVRESNEDDNIFEKTVIWTGPDALTEQELTFYTTEQLQQMLSNLQEVLDIKNNAISPSGTDHSHTVLTIAEAGYYLITGKSLQDERVDIFLLKQDQYLDWIDDDFSDEFAISTESEHPAILDKREKIKTEYLGYTTRQAGKVAVVVNAERPVVEVINTLTHELGHMRSILVNPGQTDSSYFLEGIHEAQAQQFERIFWLTLGDFIGRSLIAYPDFGDVHEFIDHSFQTWETQKDSSEHSLGRLLQWLVVLDDTNLSDLRIEMLDSASLEAKSSLILYDYLVALDPAVIDSYVSDRLASLDEWRSTILRLAKLRLVTLDDIQIEGAADLREPGLMAP